MLLLGEARLAQSLGHMLACDRVGIALQIPPRRLCAATGQSAYLGKRAPGLLIAPELGWSEDDVARQVAAYLTSVAAERESARLPETVGSI